MSIKENLDYVKGELDSQEQLLQNAIRGELFFKKHKIKIISILVVAALFATGFGVKFYINESNIKAANSAYSAILSGSKDEQIINELKMRAPSMFALYALQNSDENSSKLIDEALNLDLDPVIKEILLSAKNGSSKEILSNYGALINGYEALKNDKIEQAKLEFAKIPQGSNLKNIAVNLEHYQGKMK